MTKSEYMEFHRAMCDKMWVSIVFLTRMSDKTSRIESFVENETLQVMDESVEDTLLDLANYAILFAGYLKEQRTKIVTQDHSQPSEMHDDIPF